MNDLVSQVDIPQYGEVSRINEGRDWHKESPIVDPFLDQMPEGDPKSNQPAEIDPADGHPSEREPPMTEEDTLDPSKNPMRVDLWNGMDVWM